MSLVEGRTLDQIAQYLDLAAKRQNIVAENIANIDTPGYQTRDVDFAAELRKLLTGDTSAAQEIQVRGLVSRPDGNNVSADREGLLLAQSQLQFHTAVQLLRSQLQRVSIAVNEGRIG